MTTWGLGFHSSVLREAVTLYRAGMSCRAVSVELRSRMDPGPSQQWVFERLRERGEIRSKSRAQQVRGSRDHGRDYDRLRAQAVGLARRNLPQREIARRLGVSRSSVRRWLPRDLRMSVSESLRVRAWAASTPQAHARVMRRRRVLKMSAEGATYREIREETGVSSATIHKYRRETGMVKMKGGVKR